jgi:hypothetical protein
MAVDSSHFELISPQKTILLKGKVGEFIMCLMEVIRFIFRFFVAADSGQKFALSHVNPLLVARQ